MILLRLLRLLHFLLLILIIPFGHGQVTAPNLPAEGVVSGDFKGFLDPNLDYAYFVGRVTDRSEEGHVLKVQSDNDNVKFFRAGDALKFTVGQKKKRRDYFCYGNIRSVEEGYFVVYVRDLKVCHGDEYFRRGTILQFTSETLRERIHQASQYRELLLLRKDDYLKQLSQVNHFIWSFDEQKINLAAEYDRKIVELQKEKQRALDSMLEKKQDRIVLQDELRKKLDEIDHSLRYYHIERYDPLANPWVLDHDLGLPMQKRPQQRLEAKKK